MIRSFVTKLLIAFALGTELFAADKPPAVGEEAPDFELKSLTGDAIQLAALLEHGPVVVIALRGYPGYQCSVCNKQFGLFRDQADEFAKRKAQVVFVYPGPADKLTERAQEFLKSRELPPHFSFVLDPDHKFAETYGIRWDEPNETVYPSTFVVAADQKIVFAKTSKTHGGRAKVEEVLKAVGGK